MQQQALKKPLGTDNDGIDLHRQLCDDHQIFKYPRKVSMSALKIFLVI